MCEILEMDREEKDEQKKKKARQINAVPYEESINNKQYFQI